MDKILAERINRTQAADCVRIAALQAEAVKQLLEYCSLNPDAAINIQITTHDGQSATARLFDNAQFVQSLWQALDDFQQDVL